MVDYLIVFGVKVDFHQSKAERSINLGVTTQFKSIYKI